jgi:hypothetical protein
LIALLLQAFWPLAAAAGMARAYDGPGLDICTAQGLVEVAVDDLASPQKSSPTGLPHIQRCHLCCQGIHLSGILPAVPMTAPYLVQDAPPARPLTSEAFLFFAAGLPPRGPPAAV